MSTARSRRRSRQDEALHWETHSLDDEAGEEVAVEVKKPLSVILSLRLDSEQIHRLKEVAARHHMGITTMARMLLNQALEEPLPQSGAPDSRQSVSTSGVAEDRIEVSGVDYITLSIEKVRELAQEMAVQSCDAFLDAMLRHSSSRPTSR